MNEDNLLVSWKTELSSRPHAWLCFTSTCLWLTLLTGNLFSVYNTITSIQGLRVYMSLISHNLDAESCLPEYESQIISEQNGSAEENWH